MADFKEYIQGISQGEITKIYVALGGVHNAYNSYMQMASMDYITNQTIFQFRDDNFAHLNDESIGQWYTYFGYRIKNNADPNDNNKYLLYQYKPMQKTSATEYGYTMDVWNGIYRYVVADITDNIMTIVQTVWEYNAGYARLNAAGGFDPRSHGGVRSLTPYVSVVLFNNADVGTCFGVLPTAFVQYNDNSSEFTSGNNGYTQFALPFSKVSGYDPTPVIEDDPYKPGGTSGTGGGMGDFDPQDDPIPKPSKDDLNPVSTISTGLVTYFHANKANLVSLAQSIFVDNIIQMLKNYFSSPYDIIAGLYMLPVQPVDGQLYYPKIGIHTFGVQMPVIFNQYVEKDCGSLYIQEFYGGAFDYSPTTKISIFLPYIGVRELNVDEIMGKWLHVSYLIDVETGDCIAFVEIGDGTAGSYSVRYQFPGNCSQQIPFSGASFDSAVKAAVSFATVAVSSVITAGAAGVAAGAAGAALESGAMGALEDGAGAAFANQAQSAINTRAISDMGAAALDTVMNSKPIVERAGSIGTNIGFMSVLTPFIIRTIPRQSLPDEYSKYYGYPSNIKSTLSGVSGYTVVDSVKLHGIPGTDAEIAEIERLLKGGVVL